MDLPYQEPGQILDALGESMVMQVGFSIPPMNYGHPGLVPQGGPGSTSALPDSKAGDTGKLSKTMVLLLIKGLNRHVAELENLDGVHQQQVAHMIAHQSHCCEAGNQQMCEHFEKHLRDLDGSVLHHIAVVMKSFERPPAMRDVDGANEESSDDSEGEVDRVGASLEAYSDRALLVKHLPVSWPKDDEAWPTDSVTSTKSVRFWWGESHTHSDNHEGLCKIWTYIREKGALFSLSAEKALKVISEEHLRERVIEKYHSFCDNLHCDRRSSGISVVVVVISVDGEKVGLSDFQYLHDILSIAMCFCMWASIKIPLCGN
ncbi:uncharacterized protein EDB91DRAFT_1087289 [Suillus paluster]|uniref:uncharacterized protein n=1 Tax=Suillus paluster TaxID=48578 RepID=UPI001B8768E7|nr:uncharacterized protein EDB91DRAFT_1087289 [Suillus paluster]KAG1724935.1 hypothetical protein EDB91DRAFT_1087289 [Suillus paluster]